MGIESFGLQEEQVAISVGKTNDFVFDGGTVAGPCAFDLSAVDRGALQVVSNDLVGALVGVSNVAENLWQSLSRGIEGEVALYTGLGL